MKTCCNRFINDILNKYCFPLTGQDYSHPAVNPSNQCQWCDLYDSAARASSAWSNRPTVPCDDGNKCTKQDTCNAGRCSPLFIFVIFCLRFNLFLASPTNFSLLQITCIVIHYKKKI